MWAEEQRQRCPRCNTFDWEWEENEQAWHADTWRCKGCEQRDALTRHIQSEAQYAPPSDLDGLQLRMFRTPREES